MNHEVFAAVVFSTWYVRAVYTAHLEFIEQALLLGWFCCVAWWELAHNCSPVVSALMVDGVTDFRARMAEAKAFMLDVRRIPVENAP